MKKKVQDIKVRDSELWRSVCKRHGASGVSEITPNIKVEGENCT
jgi:hypothetical protein